MTFFLIIIAYLSPILSSLDCERVEYLTEGLIIPTTYCYAGKFTNSGIVYASTSFEYECIDGTPYYVTYTNGECRGDGVKESVANNADYNYWCGKTACDVVQLTLYDEVSNTECVDAEHNASLLDSKARFSGAFLLDWCNYMTPELGLKLSCGDNIATLSSYTDPEKCKTEFDTTTFDTELAVNCNKTSYSLGTLTAISATCDMPQTEEKKKNMLIIIIVVVVVVLLVIIGVAVYCYLQKKKEKDGDEKYSHLVGDDEQGVTAEN